jgi:hypothetical protein
MFTSVSRIGLTVLVCAVLLQVDARLFAQANAADPLIGEWVLDRAKSTYQGNPPDWRTMTFEKTPMGIRHTTTFAVNDVQQKHVYTFQVDGKDYPADVQMPINTAAFRKIDANTFERVGKYQGAVTETVTYTLSNGGKTLTADQRLTANPNVLNSSQVFNRK